MIQTEPERKRRVRKNIKTYKNDIKKGDKVKISSINIEGNEEFSDWQVKRMMKKTKEKFFLRFWKRSKFIEEEYKADKENIVKKFKEKVREKIDQPMLKKMLPTGTILKNVYMEKRDGNKTFGRQIGTYPLLVGVKYPLELNKYYNIAVTDYGYRSITGIKNPIKIDEAKFQELRSIPKVGEKRAAKLFRESPKSKEEFLNIFSDNEVGKSILKYIAFDD